ncbi:hypothetical protein HELRODRAFT_159581 [Helobdella robusta]|uniref:Uncharacterized protein n=1 Tax=Helobdella robusta TaxID=6412 RepID=T1EP69_HELRO|nr:hypothetical protein HELRODRAFT_159581 [Helobdella robusta]ESO12987.1 hypothetical protein HELRODRAFT_159581 [Helobdella robusta]
MNNQTINLNKITITTQATHADQNTKYYFLEKAYLRTALEQKNKKHQPLKVFPFKYYSADIVKDDQPGPSKTSQHGRIHHQKINIDETTYEKPIYCSRITVNLKQRKSSVLREKRKITVIPQEELTAKTTKFRLNDLMK